MKICVLGLDCASPEVIFADERLVNLRRLMDLGVYGRLQSVVPTSAVPAWMCMSTSQDPGSLGVYGPRNRTRHTYDKLEEATSASVNAPSIWDHLAVEGKKSIIVGMPPDYPPRRVNGISIGCSLTPDTTKDDFTYPASIKAKLTELVGEYPFEVKVLPTQNIALLNEEVVRMSEKQWQVARWLLSEQEWDYFHFVDIGLKCHENLISDYYLMLDEQIGSILELLDNDTILLIVSGDGAQRLDGGIAINEWLIREGLLVLNEYPKAVTSFEKLNVNWSKTKAWNDGENYASIFFNVQGREPQGVIAPAEYASFQNEMKARLEALPNDKGHPQNLQVFVPQEIYRNIRNVAPDLIVHFGPDGDDTTPCGMFILTAPNLPLSGEYEGAHLLDIAPTLLDLAGYKIPGTMQGRSLVAGMEKKSRGNGSSENDKIIHDRLAGLGYV